METIETSAPSERPGLDRPDRWILAKLQETVESVTHSLDRFETRAASQAAFYRFEEHLRWYRKRVSSHAPGTRWTEQQILETRLRLLAPIMPYLANELNERLTGTPAEEAPWPVPDESLSDEMVLLEEKLVRDVFEDVRDIVDVTGADPSVIRLYVAPSWKREILDIVTEVGADVGQVMGAAMEHEHLRAQGNAVNDLVQTLVDMARGREDGELETLAAIDECALYADASAFLARAFDAEVEIWEADDPAAVDPGDKRGEAIPLRPAIHLG